LHHFCFSQGIPFVPFLSAVGLQAMFFLFSVLPSLRGTDPTPLWHRSLPEELEAPFMPHEFNCCLFFVWPPKFPTCDCGHAKPLSSSLIFPQHVPLTLLYFLPPFSPHSWISRFLYFSAALVLFTSILFVFPLG